ncbi:hypothetical protein FOZG_04045 [Fusarium oxysporum Fo47]|uniref:Uncharacterized protein n=1 Tax=Fusarium oxysporum Fo47 TaxID=660027 RepID=W9L0H5_FUSOX|nr:hypothetical protein FOZG_04045 [Fusarium oxysporum Fo47]
MGRYCKHWNTLLAVSPFERQLACRFLGVRFQIESSEVPKMCKGILLGRPLAFGLRNDQGRVPFFLDLLDLRRRNGKHHGGIGRVILLWHRAFDIKKRLDNFEPCPSLLLQRASARASNWQSVLCSCSPLKLTHTFASYRVMLPFRASSLRASKLSAISADTGLCVPRLTLRFSILFLTMSCLKCSESSSSFQYPKRRHAHSSHAINPSEFRGTMRDESFLLGKGSTRMRRSGGRSSIGKGA